MELLKALFESAELPAEFKEKTTTLFEAAVAERVAADVVALQEAADKQLTEAKDAFIAEAVAAVDAVVEETVLEWAKENAVALDSEIKGQIAESFLQGLKGIFEKADIELSGEGAGVVVAQLQEQNAALAAQADEAKKALTEAQAQLVAIKVKEIIAEMTEGLADTQVHRVTKLVEAFEFKTEADFRAKAAMVVEAVGGKIVAVTMTGGSTVDGGTPTPVPAGGSTVSNKVDTAGTENEDGELVKKPKGNSVHSAENADGKPVSTQTITQPGQSAAHSDGTRTPPGGAATVGNGVTVAANLFKEQVEGMQAEAAPHLHSDLVAETMKLFR